MSNMLAIASVTRLMKDLLHDALIDGDVSSSVGTDVKVTALPPDKVVDGEANGETTQLNVFLHQVTPNVAWRNMDLPTRDSNGALIDTPVLALDLHYLLTAYASEELHAEILLGYAMQLFHENAILDREAVRAALGDSVVTGGTDSTLPPAFQAVAASEIADQFEVLKITPETLSTDDMSKLWTALQTHYRTTVAYLVSVVLIQGRAQKLTALPVLTRGEGDPVTGRDQGVPAQPDLLPRFPTITSIVPPNEQISVRMGEALVVNGHHLDGTIVSARFVQPRTRDELILQTLGTPEAERARISLPPDPAVGPPPGVGDARNPANWRAGTYNITVVVERAGQRTRESNTMPVILAPAIASVNASTNAAGVTTFAVSVRPPVHDTQVASLIIGARELPSDALASGANSTLTFRGEGFPSGATFPIRLRVDGVDSLLVDRTVRPPRFDPTQAVTIP